MNIDNVRAFVAVVESGGFNAAAELLSVAQPSLTRRVQHLEAELGLQLLERGPWGIRLTGRGAAFLKGAQRIILTMDEVEAETTASRHETIRLGAAATAAGSFLAARLSDWIRQNPAVRLLMIEDGARDMRQRLEKRECDLGVVAGPLPTHFEHRFVTRVTVQALLPTDHHLARSAAPLSVADLHNERVVLNSDGFLSTELMHAACSIAQVEPDVVYQCSVGQTLAALAESGLGIAIMGDSVDLRGYALPVRPICDTHGQLLAFDLYIAWLKDRVLSPVSMTLVEHLCAPA